MNNKNETFKDIIGFEGLYQISNQGRVKSLYTNKILKLSLGGRGYYLVKLAKNGIKKTFSVHRLVIKQFIPNPDNKGDVNHINGIKTDNRIENLEWMTRSENMLHSCYTLGSLIKSVIQMDLNDKILNIYTSINKASKENNISIGNISSVCSGKRKTAGGYKWKFNV